MDVITYPYRDQSKTILVKGVPGQILNQAFKTLPTRLRFRVFTGETMAMKNEEHAVFWYPKITTFSYLDFKTITIHY